MHFRVIVNKIHPKYTDSKHELELSRATKVRCKMPLRFTIGIITHMLGQKVPCLQMKMTMTMIMNQHGQLLLTIITWVDARALYSTRTDCTRTLCNVLNDTILRTHNHTVLYQYTVQCNIVCCSIVQYGRERDVWLGRRSELVWARYLSGRSNMIAAVNNVDSVISSPYLSLTMHL